MAVLSRWSNGLSGKEAPLNKNRTIKWYHMAARRGNDDAQFCLGKYYEEAVKVEDHGEKAVKWFHMAAEQGHTGAQFHLGRIYATGRIVGYNGNAAEKWLCMAAEQGNQVHQLYVGNFLKGKGARSAEQWFHKAAAQGNEEAQFHLAKTYERDWEGSMKALRKLANQRCKIARFFIEAEEGLANAQFELGLCYYNGKWVDVDYSEAVKWFRLAAEQKHGWACTKLAEMYRDGEGVMWSSRQSAMWRNRANRYLPYPRRSAPAQPSGTSSWLSRHKQS